jgi:hypothetical protein
MGETGGMVVERMRVYALHPGSMDELSMAFVAWSFDGYIWSVRQQLTLTVVIVSV